MLLKNKFFPILTAAAAVIIFSTANFAQDNKTTTPTGPKKAERPFKGEGRGDGNRKFGRQALGGRMGMRGGMRGGPMAMMRGLNLTDAQKDQMRNIIKSNKPDQANKDRINAFREARKSGTPPTDEQKAQMKVFREQAQTKAKSVHEQILNVLTDDQKAQLKQRHEQMQQRREQFQQKREQFRKNRPDKSAPKATDKPKIT